MATAVCADPVAVDSCVVPGVQTGSRSFRRADGSEIVVEPRGPVPSQASVQFSMVGKLALVTMPGLSYAENIATGDTLVIGGAILARQLSDNRLLAFVGERMEGVTRLVITTVRLIAAEWTGERFEVRTLWTSSIHNQAYGVASNARGDVAGIIAVETPVATLKGVHTGTDFKLSLLWLPAGGEPRLIPLVDAGRGARVTLSPDGSVLALRDAQSPLRVRVYDLPDFAVEKPDAILEFGGQSIVQLGALVVDDEKCVVAHGLVGAGGGDMPPPLRSVLFCACDGKAMKPVHDYGWRRQVSIGLQHGCVQVVAFSLFQRLRTGTWDAISESFPLRDLAGP